VRDFHCEYLWKDRPLLSLSYPQQDMQLFMEKMHIFSFFALFFGGTGA
jgi:hypothetical protein